MLGQSASLPLHQQPRRRTLTLEPQALRRKLCPSVPPPARRQPSRDDDRSRGPHSRELGDRKGPGSGLHVAGQSNCASTPALSPLTAAVPAASYPLAHLLFANALAASGTLISLNLLSRQFLSLSLDRLSESTAEVPSVTALCPVRDCSRLLDFCRSSSDTFQRHVLSDDRLERRLASRDLSSGTEPPDARRSRRHASSASPLSLGVYLPRRALVLGIYSSVQRSYYYQAQHRVDLPAQQEVALRRGRLKAYGDIFFCPAGAIRTSSSSSFFDSYPLQGSLNLHQLNPGLSRRRRPEHHRPRGAVFSTLDPGRHRCPSRSDRTRRMVQATR